jgi:sugar/nucleoside kinase (ribokinase family)
MVDLVIVGSVAFDTVETPFGSVKETLGGSATYASLAASFFAKAGIVAVVGNDFNNHDVFHTNNICTKGLKTVEGKTFRWSGYYEYDMNQAHTIQTEENVFKGFMPDIPEEYKNAGYVFLGNIGPELQMHVLKQMKNPVAIMDVMNYWIERTRDRLFDVMKKCNILLMNDAEARELFETTNLITAGQRALKVGLQAVVIKKGEHGVLLFTENNVFCLPGYPCEDLKDPTGAGDSFAGAFTGYLAKNDVSEESLRKAVVYGSTVASFNVEDFSFNNLKRITINDIESRYKGFRNLINF